MTSTHVLSLEQAYQLALRALRSNGFNQAHAEAVAQNVTCGERDGCASHGLYRLLGCVRSLQAGKVSADAIPGLFDQARLSCAPMPAAHFLCWPTAPLCRPLSIRCAPTVSPRWRSTAACTLSALWADIEPLTELGAGGLLHAQPRTGDAGRRFAPAVRHQPHRLRLAAPESPAVFYSTWPPAQRRAAKSNCIAAQAPRCLKAGALIRQAIRPPMPPACWRAQC